MVKGAKVVKGNERVLEAPVAMEVVEDTTNKEPLEIPTTVVMNSKSNNLPLANKKVTSQTAYSI